MVASKGMMTVLLGAIFLVGSVCSAMGSEIRVNSLGIPGLVPDEEVDISLNPAYLRLVKGKRIFSGLDYYRPEYLTIPRYRGYLEYVHPFSTVTAGLKYNPYYFHRKFKTNGSRRSLEKGQNFDFRLGWDLNSSLLTGISLRRNDYQLKTEDDDYVISRLTTQKDIIIYSAGLGITRIYSGKNKISAIVQYGVTKTSELSDLAPFYLSKGNNKDYEAGIRLLSETALSEKNSLRSNLLLNYKWDKNYRLNYNEELSISANEAGINRNNASLSGMIGIGLVCKYYANTLWLLTLNDDLTIYDKEYEEEKTSYTTYEDIDVTKDTKFKGQNISMYFGFEQGIYKNLQLRGNLCIYNYRYERWDDKFQNQSSKYIYVSGPIHSYNFSLGYNVLKNLLFDFKISNETYFRTGSSKTYHLEFNTTYEF